jgi:hypothetical protein
VEAGEKQLEIGEEGLEAFALPRSQPLVQLLVKPRILLIDVSIRLSLSLGLSRLFNSL